jgi:hypothetical protein
MKLALATFTLSSLFATACATEVDETEVDETGNAEGGLTFNLADRCNFNLIVKKYAWSDPVTWDFLGYGAAGEIKKFHDPNDQKLEWRELAPPKDTIANGRAVRMKVERNCELQKTVSTQELVSEGEAKYAFSKSLTNGEEINIGLKIPTPAGIEFEIGYANSTSTTWGTNVEFSQKWSHKVSHQIELEACVKGEAVAELRAITVDMGLYGKLKGKRTLDCVFGEPGNHDNKKTVASSWESSNNEEALFGTTKSPLKEFKITSVKTKNPITKCADCPGCTTGPGPRMATEVCTSEEPIEIASTVEGNETPTSPDPVTDLEEVDAEVQPALPKLQTEVLEPVSL